MDALGRAARSEGAVYLTGGTSAVLLGWRDSTVDADLRFDPEAQGVFSALPRIKDQLSINIELASPMDFVPVPADWRERSEFIDKRGKLSFYHFDFRGQALAKLERGHARDLQDVRAMISSGHLSLKDLEVALDAIEDSLIRYPAIDADVFRQKIEAFLEEEA